MKIQMCMGNLQRYCSTHFRVTSTNSGLKKGYGWKSSIIQIPLISSHHMNFEFYRLELQSLTFDD